MTRVAWTTPVRPRASIAALAVAFWAAFGADAAAQGSVASDRAVLEAFYDATGGPGWTNRTSWKTSARLHEWYGVGTDGGGRVTWLNVRENGLAGTVPPALGSLTELDWLDLGGNVLTGAIPDTLGRLARLQGLILWRNELTGPVPEWLGSLAGLGPVNAPTTTVPASDGRPHARRRCRTRCAPAASRSDASRASHGPGAAGTAAHATCRVASA